MTVFIVQLRNPVTRMWGNQAEVTAETAKEAAESAAGCTLRGGVGGRADLRARVWATPFGTQPEIPFYACETASPGPA
jgi:hypothetical protein